MADRADLEQRMRDALDYLRSLEDALKPIIQRRCTTDEQMALSLPLLSAKRVLSAEPQRAIAAAGRNVLHMVPKPPPGPKGAA